MKRAIILSMIVAMLFHGFALSAAASATGNDIEEHELARAAACGLPLDKLDKPDITGSEMMELLDGIVAYRCGEERLKEWQGMYSTQRERDQPLTRFDAMAMVYFTAQFLGTGREMYEAPATDDAWPASFHPGRSVRQKRRGTRSSWNCNSEL